MNNSTRPLVFISLLMFVVVFGCIYFGFRPLLQYSTSGMSREIVLGLLGAGLVATITGVLLAFERHLDTSNRLKENRFDNILKEYSSLNTHFFSMMADESITRDEVSKLNEILYRIYLVGNPSSYKKLEKLVKEIENFYYKHNREVKNENEVVKITDKYPEWTKRLEDIIKYHFRNDLKFEVETRLNDFIEEFKASKSLTNKAKKPELKNNEGKKERSKSKDQTRYVLSSRSGEKLNKSEYVLALFKLNFTKNTEIKTYEDFLEIFTEQDDDDFWDNEMRMHAYKSSNPYWLTEEKANKKKKVSTEGTGWDRYYMDREDIIEFKGSDDDYKIVVRKGHSIDSVQALEKLFEKRFLKIGKKVVPN